MEYLCNPPAAGPFQYLLLHYQLQKIRSYYIQFNWSVYFWYVPHCQKSKPWINSSLYWHIIIWLRTTGHHVGLKLQQICPLGLYWRLSTLVQWLLKDILVQTRLFLPATFEFGYFWQDYQQFNEWKVTLALSVLMCGLYICIGWLNDAQVMQLDYAPSSTKSLAESLSRLKSASRHVVNIMLYY